MLTIKKFTPDDGLWVIVIVSGELRRHPRHNHRSLISFVIAPSRENDETKLGHSSDLIDYDQSNLRLVWTSIEYLPILIAGSVWTSANPNADKCIYYPKKTLSIKVVYPEFPEFIDLGKSKYVGKDGEMYAYMPKEIYPIGQGLAAKAMTFDSSLGKVIIPCSEILRAEYGEAPILLEALVSGWLVDRTLQKDIINIEKTQSKLQSMAAAGVKGIYIHFGPRMGGRRNDRALALLCNIIFNKFTRNRMFACDAAIKSSGQYNKRIEISPPNHGKFELEVSGFRYKLKDGNPAIFILSIRKSTCSLAIKEFEWDADNDNRKSDNKPNPLTSCYPDRPTEPRYDHEVEEDINLSLDDASASKSTTTINMPLTVHTDEFKIKKAPKSEQKSENQKPTLPQTATSGIGQEKSEHGDPGTSILEYRPDNEFIVKNQRHPRNIELLVDAIERMLIGDPELCKKIRFSSHQFKMSFLHRNITYKREGVTIEAPIYISDLPLKINGVEHDFCNVTINGTSYARKILIVIMSYENQQCALVEAERERAIYSDDKTPQSSTYLCRHISRNSFQKSDLDEIIASVCRNGPTLMPAEALPMLVKKRLKHTKKDLKSSSSLPSRLKLAIMALFEDTKPSRSRD